MTRVAKPRAVKSDRLGSTLAAKLCAGSSFKIIAFGDSITAGGEAIAAGASVSESLVAFLQKKYPPGENLPSRNDARLAGTTRLTAWRAYCGKVLDAVLAGRGAYRLWDERPATCTGVGGVEPGQFKANLKSMVESIRKETHADVILYSTFPPNPNWHYGTRTAWAAIRRRRHAKRRTETEQRIYADVYSVFDARCWSAKKPESLLANNINHPNDFGHWLYEQALEAIQFLSG